MCIRDRQNLTHDMENVFSEVRNGNIKVDSRMVDVLFQCCLLYTSYYIRNSGRPCSCYKRSGYIDRVCTVSYTHLIAGESVDVLVNGKYVAKGEVVVIEESFGVRITEIIK